MTYYTGWNELSVVGQHKIHRFEIFTLKNTMTLKPGLGVIGNDTIPYDFLLMFNSNYGSILHHFQHI